MKLSIIMPCFNVADTLERALNSIFMQRVNFDYEIIIIDDCSTDNSLKLAQKIAESHPCMRIICNEVNSGNAHSFYVGLKASLGDYFCVLDGDDYYTIPDKLQRQIDFFDRDVEEDYVASATQFIIDLGNGNISIPDRSTYKEFSYSDYITQASGYYHTATYMYRNIFRGNVPDVFDNPMYRGDNPRTIFHLIFSGKKVKILDFVGSAYVFEFNGIWSGKTQKQQFEEMMLWQRKHKENVETAAEKRLCDKLAETFKKSLETATDDYRRYPLITIDEAMEALVFYTKRFAFKEKDFMFKHFFASQYIDTLCASIGYINKIRDEASVQVARDENNLAIVISYLNPGGGGIFEEIDELVQLYKDKNIYIVCTNGEPILESAIERLSVYDNIQVLTVPKDEECKYRWLARTIARIAPFRAYFYTGHDDPRAIALMQESPCEKIVLFSYDHGYICGITSPYIDNIIAKRATDYYMLQKRMGDRVIYIPTWGAGAIDCEGMKYVPFKNHDKLITACGAARFYKVDGIKPRRYVDMFIELLKRSGGMHYHFGQIPDEVLKEIDEKLATNGIPKVNFVYVPWADNLPKYLLEKNVDVFLEPFPVGSYKLTLDILAVGVPIMVYKGLKKNDTIDFIPDNMMEWYYPEDMYQKLTTVSAEELLAQSETEVTYFEQVHSEKVIKKYIRNNQEVCVPNKVAFADNSILEMMDNLRIIDNNFKVLVFRQVQIFRNERENKRIEAAKLVELKRKEEEAAKLAELKRQEEEAAKLAEQKRKEEEAKRQAEILRIKSEEERKAALKKLEEAKRIAEQKRKEEEAKRQAEIKKLEEAKRQAELKRKEEERRLAELKKQELEAKAQADAKRLAEIKAEITKIRSTLGFKVGYALSYPLRLVKQSIRYSQKYGVSKGLSKMSEDGILEHHAQTPEKELKALKSSTSLKWGNKIASPWRRFKKR